MKMNLNCQEVSRLISDGQDRDLPAAERVVGFICGDSFPGHSHASQFLP